MRMQVGFETPKFGGEGRSCPYPGRVGVPAPGSRLLRSDISDLRSRWQILSGPSICGRAHLYAAPEHVGGGVRSRGGVVGRIRLRRTAAYAGSYKRSSENSPSTHSAE